VDIVHTVQLEIVEPLKARISELEAQRLAVLALHEDNGDGRCYVDGNIRPCATVRALGVTE
jgi:hypothetical protein